MTKPNSEFKMGSRTPFAEESVVLDAARQAAGEVAHQRGQPQGRALFKVTGRVLAVPTFPYQAVDLVREAIAQQAPQAATVVRRGEVVAPFPKASGKPGLFSDLSSGDAGMVESLRRIGIQLQSR